MVLGMGLKMVLTLSLERRPSQEFPRATYLGVPWGLGQVGGVQGA